MVSNFEEVITGLRQCREKLFSDNGVMGCLVSIEAEAEDIKTILSAMDDPYAYEIIFLLSRVLELIHIIHGQDLQSYDKHARELENKIQGRAYSSSSFNISDEVKTGVFVTRGSAGGVRESEAQLRAVEEPKIENLPARNAGTAERPTVSMRDVQTRLDEMLEGVRRKEWRGKDKDGRPRTDYYDHDDFKVKDKEYSEAQLKYKKDLKEYNERKKQAELEGREFTEAPPKDLGPRPQHALWKDAEERFAPDLQTAMQLDEEGLKHHRVVKSEDYQGQIPQETAEHLQQATQKIMEDGYPPHYPGANEGRIFNNEPWTGEGEGKILPTTDVEGNPITYTEMDFMAPQPKIGENGKVELTPNGKPETTRGDDRLIVGSNGSIYYSPDHYHTFILIVE